MSTPKSLLNNAHILLLGCHTKQDEASLLCMCIQLPVILWIAYHKPAAMLANAGWNHSN